MKVAWVTYRRHWWRIGSVRISSVGAVLSIIVASAVHVSGAAALAAVLDYRIVLGIVGLLFGANIFAALVDQPKLKKPPQEPPR